MTYPTPFVVFVIAWLLMTLGCCVLIAGVMKAAGNADEQLEHLEPKDLKD